MILRRLAERWASAYLVEDLRRAEARAQIEHARAAEFEQANNEALAALSNALRARKDAERAEENLRALLMIR